MKGLILFAQDPKIATKSDGWNGTQISICTGAGYIFYVKVTQCRTQQSHNLESYDAWNVF